MKSALILEKDTTSSIDTARMLKWLGYISAPVGTGDEALNIARAISFDLIVTHTAEKPYDRRSLTGELKRLAPEAAIVLISDNGNEHSSAKTWYYSGASAVIIRPPTIEAFRKILVFGIDGYGLQPANTSFTHERRRTLL